MTYRNITPVLQHIDTLFVECGLGGKDNNCLSKSKLKQEPGRCFSGDCPLAYEADLWDLVQHDYDLFVQYYMSAVMPEGTIESGWVVQYREVAYKKKETCEKETRIKILHWTGQNAPGESMEKCEKDLGLSHETVRRHMRKLGVK